MTNTQNEPVELLPCPFCGGPAKFVPFTDDIPFDEPFGLVTEHTAQCHFGAYLADDQQIIAAWNARPASSAVVDALREPVAWAMRHPDEFDELEWAKPGQSEPLTPADRAAGWTAQPLFAALANTPKQSAGLVEELAGCNGTMTPQPDNLVERLKDEGARNGGSGSYAWQSRALCVEAADRINSLESAFAPFVDIKHQRTAHAVISKKLGAFDPITITVTKAQLLAAFSALEGDRA